MVRISTKGNMLFQTQAVFTEIVLRSRNDDYKEANLCLTLKCMHPVLNRCLSRRVTKIIEDLEKPCRQEND